LFLGLLCGGGFGLVAGTIMGTARHLERVLKES
jgi:ABC-type nitrate/sulfonate/bicarbonate transport system permease component